MQQSTSEGRRNLKSLLAARELLVGTFLKTPAPVVAEILAATELDLLCLDAEHAPFDRRDLDGCIFAAKAHGKPVLVRVPAASAEHVLSALDMGADGIVAPHIREAADARELVRMAHFVPGGADMLVLQGPLCTPGERWQITWRAHARRSWSLP